MVETEERKEWLEEQKKLKSELSLLLGDAKITKKKKLEKIPEEEEEEEEEKPKQIKPTELTSKDRQHFNNRFSPASDTPTEPQVEPEVIAEEEKPKVAEEIETVESDTEVSSGEAGAPEPVVEHETAPAEPSPQVTPQPTVEEKQVVPQVQPQPTTVKTLVPKKVLRPKLMKLKPKLDEEQPSETEEPVQQPEVAEPEIEPTVQEPGTQGSKVAQPEIQEPIVQGPSVQEPTVQEPVAQVPEVAQPEIQEPTIQEPVAQVPEVAQPKVQEPVTQEQSIPEPTAQEPTVQEPVAQESEVTQPGIQQPCIQGPTIALQQPTVSPNIVPQPTVQTSAPQPVVQPTQPTSSPTLVSEQNESQMISQQITTALGIIEKSPEYINFEKGKELITQARNALALNKINDAKSFAEKGLEEINGLYQEFINALKVLKITKEKILEAKSSNIDVSIIVKIFQQAKDALKNNDFQNAINYSNLCVKQLTKDGS